jgi:homocitrate synthase
LRVRYPNIDLEGHFHDDRGLAVVNALEAVRCGVRYINTSLLGIGERSGITSMTALLFNLLVDRAYDHLEGYQLRGSYPFNVMIASKLNTLVPSKEPVSLTNRTHTGGVHQKAVLSDIATYEAHPLDQFGVTETEMLLGPLSGWNAVYYFLKEIQYFRVDEPTARAITKEFKRRVYDDTSGLHPSKVLVELAEREFGLQRREDTEAYLDAVVQRMDSLPPFTPDT